MPAPFGRILAFFYDATDFPHRSQPFEAVFVLDHLGLVAGMFDALGRGHVLDQAMQQNPAMRDLTLGEAVKAMVLNGLGCITQALSLVPRFFQHKPTSRLMSSRAAPEQLNDDALGRALEMLYAYGVTARYRLVAATAAPRLGLAPRFAHLDSTSVHGEGRYHSDDAPDAHGMHLTRGDSWDHRPDLHHMMLDLMVAPQAGIPVLLKPHRGKSRDVQDVDPHITAPMAPLQSTDGTRW